MKKSLIAALSIATLSVSMVASVASAQTVTSTANFSRGDSVIVASKVNVRSGPNGSIVGSQSTGAKGMLVGGPANANGYTWWKMDYVTGVDGWTAEDFLQHVNVALVTIPQQTAHSSIDQKIADLRAQLSALLAQIGSLQSAQTAAAAASQ